MVVLQGFIDDSGQGHDNVYALAGFLSTAERWEIFSDEWERICGQEPKMPNFKMTRARQGVGKRYSDVQLAERVRELTSLTKQKAMYRVAAVTANPNYRKIVEGQIPRNIDSVYFLLFFTVLMATSNLMDRESLEGTVDFVFDKQGAIEAECVRWYNWIKDSPQVPESLKKRLGSTPIFRHDDNVLPLKAADMFAWHLRRHLNNEDHAETQPGEYLTETGEMFGVDCIVDPTDLASFAYSVKHKNGLGLHSHCTFFLPRTAPDRGRHLK